MGSERGRRRLTQRQASSPSWWDALPWRLDLFVPTLRGRAVGAPDCTRVPPAPASCLLHVSSVQKAPPLPTAAADFCDRLVTQRQRRRHIAAVAAIGPPIAWESSQSKALSSSFIFRNFGVPLRRSPMCTKKASWMSETWNGWRHPHRVNALGVHVVPAQTDQQHSQEHAERCRRRSLPVGKNSAAKNGANKEWHQQCVKTGPPSARRAGAHPSHLEKQLKLSYQRERSQTRSAKPRDDENESDMARPSHRRK